MAGHLRTIHVTGSCAKFRKVRQGRGAQSASQEKKKAAVNNNEVASQSGIGFLRNEHANFQNQRGKNSPKVPYEGAAYTSDSALEVAISA